MSFVTELLQLAYPKKIASLVEGHDRITIMEVCGSHTMSIYRYGLKKSASAKSEITLRARVSRMCYLYKLYRHCHSNGTENRFMFGF